MDVRPLFLLLAWGEVPLPASTDGGALRDESFDREPADWEGSNNRLLDVLDTLQNAA